MGSAGYGRHRGLPAHRVVYSIIKEHVSPELDLHHICENHHCVNPDHLLPLTRKQHGEAHSQ